jgi:O-methyltransferase
VTARLIRLDGLAPELGLCWACSLPAGCTAGDSSEQPQRSSLRLFENGHEIGPAHSTHDEIRKFGGGRYSHWGDRLYLSAAAPGARPDQCSYTMLVEPVGEASRRAVLTAAAAIDAEQLTPETRYAWGERVFAAFVPDVKLAEFGRSFFQDQQFIADYERFDRVNYRSLDRKFVLKELLRLALRRPGALAECGVFRGASAFLMAQAIRRDGSNRRLHLFDSFAGLSAPGAMDGPYWAAGSLACSQVEVAANLAQFADLVSFHDGWFPQRFDEVAEAYFCFVHIDVDLFQPTRDSLEFFYPRIVAGGMIVCDDYGFETCPGARRAMDSFFAERPEPIVHLPTGQGFVVIEPPQPAGLGQS